MTADWTAVDGAVVKPSAPWSAAARLRRGAAPGAGEWIAKQSGAAHRQQRLAHLLD
jgi:hypothetical protein